MKELTYRCQESVVFVNVTDEGQIEQIYTFPEDVADDPILNRADFEESNGLMYAKRPQQLFEKEVKHWHLTSE